MFYLCSMHGLICQGAVPGRTAGGFAPVSSKIWANCAAAANLSLFAERGQQDDTSCGLSDRQPHVPLALNGERPRSGGEISARYRTSLHHRPAHRQSSWADYYRNEEPKKLGPERGRLGPRVINDRHASRETTSRHSCCCASRRLGKNDSRSSGVNRALGCSHRRAFNDLVPVFVRVFLDPSHRRL